MQLKFECVLILTKHLNIPKFKASNFWMWF
jgi:hypothetical protein